WSVNVKSGIRSPTATPRFGCGVTTDDAAPETAAAGCTAPSRFTLSIQYAPPSTTRVPEIRSPGARPATNAAAARIGKTIVMERSMNPSIGPCSSVTSDFPASTARTTPEIAYRCAPVVADRDLPQPPASPATTAAARQARIATALDRRVIGLFLM